MLLIIDQGDLKRAHYNNSKIQISAGVLLESNVT